MVRFVAVTLLFSSLLIAQPLYAKKKGERITEGNSSNFQETSDSGYVCKVEGDSFAVGKLKGQSFVGGRYVPINTTQLDRQIQRLDRKITKLNNKARLSRKKQRKLNKLNRKISNKRALELRVQRLLQECSGETGESFSGRSNSLAKYSEILTLTEVNHLLDKVAFGGNAELRDIGLNQGLTPLVNALVDGVYSNAEANAFERDVATWTDLGMWDPEEEEEDFNGKIWTIYAVQGGQMYRMLYSRNPFHEWMTLQLSSHFATNLDAIGFSFADYLGYGLKEHWDLIHDNSVGNFRSLAHGMLEDSAMNFWLDNKDNSAESPNQNFARELLELFLLGAIDVYTKLPNYGEDSVVAATGFVSGYEESFQIEPVNENEVIDIRFNENLRDNTARTIFSGIAGAEITQSLTAAGLIDHILYNHPGSARYIAERFAGDMIFPGISEDIVVELASDLIANNYSLKPFLKKVLSSEAMFSSSAQNACISSPIEHFVKVAKRIYPRNLRPTGNAWEGNFGMIMSVVNAAATSGHRLFAPPSVFGWKKDCNINRNGAIASGEEWISAQRLLQRTHGCAELFNHLNERETDYLELFGLTVESDPRAVADRIAQQIYDLRLTQSELDILEQFFYEYVDNSSPGQIQPIVPNFRNEWFVSQKFAAVACAIGTIYRVNLR